jgi:dTDP-4-amino-4,6-dideoxygalactose transaminase
MLVPKNIVRLSKSIVGKEEAIAVSEVIEKDGYLGMGKVVQLFETEIAEYLGVPEEWVACVSSGTAALHLAIEAVTLPEDEVLVQSLTYLASFQAISAAMAIPVPCEVYQKNCLINLEDAFTRITEKTKVIMPVHYASFSGNMEKLYEFAGQNKLRVVEDAAHAFGCTYKKKKIGSFGDIVCFSFDGIKNITSGEGGCVVTSDQKVAQRIRDARLLGVVKDTEKRFSGERSWDFDVHCQGYRYHMSNIFAAIGRVQLQKLESEFAPKRRKFAELYRERLGPLKDIVFLETHLDEVVPHIQPLRIINSKFDMVQSCLKKNGVQTGMHYKPNHLLSYYGGGKVKLPVTEQLYNELLTLPLHPGLAENDVNFICDLMWSVLK